MIMDTTTNIGQYLSLNKRLAQGLETLVKTDFSSLDDGKHQIDGDNLFMILSSYTTKPVEQARPEAHKQYIDIQYLASGSECIGYAPLSQMLELEEELPEKDISFYRGETTLLPLGKDVFHIFFPQDAHAPCLANGQPAQVRKVVIKVKV